MECKGPVFITEPPYDTDFSNSTGIHLDCTAHGNPSPVIEWMLLDGTIVNTIPGIRTVFKNGTLVFHPFEAKDYRQDVHATTYRCSASNSVGTIVSRDVRIRAGKSLLFIFQIYHASFSACLHLNVCY